MDLENEKIGPAYAAPEAYFKDTESRLFQRLGINKVANETVNVDLVPEPQSVNPVVAKVDTVGVQKRARKQDPLTAKSEGVNKELDALGNVIIPPLTFSTNENPEWVNFGAIPEEISQTNGEIKVVSYGEMTLDDQSKSLPVVPDASEPEIKNPILEVVAAEVPIAEEKVSENVNPVIEDDFSAIEAPANQETAPIESIIVHEVPESVGLDELESYITTKKHSNSADVEAISTLRDEVTTSNFNTAKAEPLSDSPAEEKPISLDAPATAFAPIAGRPHESATPGWLGIAAALSAIVAAYFIWTAIQPPKIETETVALQEEEGTAIESPLDEQMPTDTIPDGLQLVEPLILEEMPKYKEPNVYTIIDAEDMPERTKRALQDLEDNGLATFDMEDELFEELDFESL